MMLEELKMGAILITLEVIVVGGNTLIKAAKSRGNVSNLVFLVYSHVFGSLFLAPAAFLFHRKLPAPKLTRVILLKILLFTCFSYVFSLSLYIGLGYASPTLASALSNVSPAYIFILAVFFRMEALDLKAQSSLLKVIGTIVSICGAFIVTFYKGVSIYVYIPSESPHWFQASSLATANWVIGGLFLASSYLFHSLEIITMTWVMRDYPSYTLVTLISCIIEAILSTIVALILEDSSTWRLGFDIELWAILYSVTASLNELVMMLSLRSGDSGSRCCERCPLLGVPQEGTCVCSHVQASSDDHCNFLGRRVSWGHSPSWKYYWRHDGCYRFLHGDERENQRSREAYRWWNVQA